MIVKLRELSSDQLPNCLFCLDKATQEAFVTNGLTTSRIRCCNNLACVELAKQCALIPFPTGQVQ